MRTTLAVALALFLCSACSDPNPVIHSKDKVDYGHKPDPMLAPVTSANAPTVRELLSNGYEVVDQRETSEVCGRNCLSEGFDALYLGKIETPVIDGGKLANYACPGTEDESDNWKCRALDPPYRPSGGLVPTAG
jgi:hypothetical protein